jgi:hypothetical protein
VASEVTKGRLVIIHDPPLGLFDADHAHFHFQPVTGSPKISFCINDSFLSEHAQCGCSWQSGLVHRSDFSLRGLDIGAVAEYDHTDPRQNISPSGVSDEAYWRRVVLDPKQLPLRK